MKRFNIYELTEALNSVGISHPLVNTVLHDRYRLNDLGDIKYPALIFIKDNIQVGIQISIANYSIIYVDRLTVERDNTIKIQSVGTQVISELLNVFYDNFDVEKTNEYFTVEYFNERYADSVAGCVSNNISFRFKSDISECYDYCIPDCLTHCKN